MTPYLAIVEADALAATLPATLLGPYWAMDAAQRSAALVQASLDVDASMRFQGRKYDAAQEREFPRVAYEPSTRVSPTLGASSGGPVWDWDEETNTAVVPHAVLIAVVYQANDIATGGTRLDDQHEGVRDQMLGPMREAYAGGANSGGSSDGLATGLCRRSLQMLKQYRLATGRLL